MHRRSGHADTTSSPASQSHKAPKKKDSKSITNHLVRIRFVTRVLGVVACLLALWYIADLFGFLRLPPSVVEGDLPRWGAWKPNLYFAMRSRTKSAIDAGLMWFPANTIGGFREIRHTCEQGQLKKYGWSRHDGVNFGTQELVDSQFKLTTSFVSSENSSSEWHWSARIRGEPLQNSSGPVPVSLFFYVTSETALSLTGAESGQQGLSKLEIDGTNTELGPFRVYAKEKSGSTIESPSYRSSTLSQFPSPLADLSKYHFVLFEASPAENRWRVKDGVVRVIGNQAQNLFQQAMSVFGAIEKFDPALVPTLPNTHKSTANVIVVQRVMHVPFELDLVCVSRRSHETANDISNRKLTERLTTESSEFEERFLQTFSGITSSGYNASQIEFAMNTFSSLIGGLGYFSGDWLKHEQDQQPPKVMPKQTLFSAVPSRSFFPRGFLWDEGFHQLLIGRWDPQLSVRVISSWINLMTSSGWIPREQILGDEARSKVPAEFQEQHEKHANPPTLVVLALKNLLDMRSTMPETTRTKLNTFLSSAFSRLRKHFQWFEESQAGALPHTFRWRGRTENHTLASGLDDYPRAQMPSDKELHVDLQVWMIAFADVMHEISTVLGSYSHASTYANKARQYRVRLDELFWNEQFGAYCDLADYEAKRYAEHKGYVSLFPVLFGLVPADSPKLAKILSYMHDRDHMWSSYGLRSLSRADDFFGTKEDYWRGPIWININYLVLRALNKYYSVDGPNKETAQKISTALRRNIVNNIYKHYTERGFVWEQYNAITGEPKGCHPFTGWSALVVLIMSQLY